VELKKIYKNGTLELQEQVKHAFVLGLCIYTDDWINTAGVGAKGHGLVSRLQTGSGRLLRTS
jgi:hypothetical protein